MWFQRLWNQFGVRLFVIFTSVAFISFLSSSIWLVRSILADLEQTQMDRYELISTRLATAVANQEINIDADPINSLSAYQSIDYGIILYDQKGEMRYSVLPMVCCQDGGVEPYLWQILDPQSGEQTASVNYESDPSMTLTYLFVPNAFADAQPDPPSEPAGNEPIHLLIYGPAANTQEALDAIIAQILSSLFIPLLALIGAVLFVSGNVSRILKNVEMVASQIIDGNYSHRAPVFGNDEFGRLATVINEMADQLQAVNETKSRFFNKVSHELRTPLTVIKGLAINSLGLLSAEQTDLRGNFEVVGQQVDHMTRMIDDLLLLSAAEVGKLTISKELWDLNELVLAEVQAHTNVARNKQFALNLTAYPSPLYANVDPQRVCQVFKILFDNAFKYVRGAGSKAGKIDISIDQEGPHAILKFKDNGPGIPSKFSSKIFSRYHQADINNQGFGLGLTIAREIISLHAGKISSANALEGGAIFTILLPLHQFELDAEN